MPRFLLGSVALIGLAAISCTNGKSLDDAGRGGQSAGSTATGGATGAAGEAEGAAGAAGGAGATGGAGGAGAGGAIGTAGAGVAGAGVVGASGDAGQADASGVAGAGAPPSMSRAGMKSAGCGKTPMGAVATSFTNHRISIPVCAACTVPNCPKNCIAPPFAPGGRDAQMTPNGETFIDRDYTIEVPATYDATHPYPVFFGADGCGPAPPLLGAGFSVPGEAAAIKVGLQQVSLPSVGMCFADGGIRCAPTIANVADCVNGPEIPYFLAVMSWVEENFCVDLGSEFAGGGSSGAWEALTAGCGAATTLRGIYTVAGGLREHRWACDGPIAAFMIASDADTNNPVGPLKQLLVSEDTYGMAPARDEILTRNGCVGKTTTPYDPKYPFCVQYTGCPAAYPVVWCEFPGGSHDNPTYNNINYLNAVVPFFMGLPPAP